jgi:hypothetical protein
MSTFNAQEFVKWIKDDQVPFRPEDEWEDKFSEIDHVASARRREAAEAKRQRRIERNRKREGK